MEAMEDDPSHTLGKTLSSIETIAMQLPGIGRRSELKVKSQEMFALIEEARRQLYALEKKLISLKYDYPAQRFERTKGVKRG